jgi:nucleoside-triphosphatase THEP1
MVTAFVVSKIQSQDLVNGLIVGIQMNFRAIAIILGFSVLGTELYNPKIRAFFLKTSFKQLPLALELSFESLPLMIAMIPELKVIVKNPVSIFYQIISQIDFRLAELKNFPSRKIFIISGVVGEGKTTQISKIVEFLKAKNIPVGGILSPRRMENDTTIGYDVVDIATSHREQFLTLTTDPDQRSIGNYAIHPSGLQAGQAALTIETNSRNKVVVIDEVGKLELENKGWANSLNELVEHSSLHLIWSVRTTFTEQVIQKWNLQDCIIFHLSEGENPQVGQAIAEQINGQGPSPI